MKVRELIAEMPLKAVSLHRSSNPGGLDSHELALVKKYIKTNEYTNKLKAVPFDLYVYILDDAVAGEYGYNYPEGIIPRSVWADGTESKYGDEDEFLDMSSDLFQALFKTIRAIADKEPKSVHFIVGDNYSDSDQISPTPWMIAHRLGHAIFGGGLRTLYGSKAFLEKLGLDSHRLFDMGRVIEAGATMKSAKTGRLQEDELSSELIAQYLVTGKITIDLRAAFEKFTELVISNSDKSVMRVQFDEQMKDWVARTENMITARMEELTSNGAVVLYI